MRQAAGVIYLAWPSPTIGKHATSFYNLHMRTWLSHQFLSIVLNVQYVQVFDRSQLYTPDDLRAANNASADAGLRDVVFPGGSGSWPTIGDLRDMIIFIADPDYLTIAQAQYVQLTTYT